MNFNYKSLYVILTVLMPLSSGYCAVPVDLGHQTAAFLQPLKNGNRTVSADASFMEISSNTDFNKTRHVRMKQTYQGVPVWGGDAVIHTYSQQGRKTQVNGHMYQGIGADLKYSSSKQFTIEKKESALNFAIRQFQAESESTVITSHASTELIVYVDQNNQSHWAYHIKFLAQSAHKQEIPVYIMDAITHKIYQSWDDIRPIANENVLGGGYGGNKKMGRVIYDNVNGNTLPVTRNPQSKICYLHDDVVTVKDDKNAIIQYACKDKDSAHGNVYWNDKNYFPTTDAYYSPENDAYHNAHIMSQMYHDWYHIPPLLKKDKSALPLVIKLYPYFGLGYWNASTEELMLGTAAGGDFMPLTTLDGITHELGHAFTRQHSGLIYQGETGGIGEAFSDMAAIAAEFYSKGTTNWMIGHDIFIPAEALRYVDDPTRDCKGKDRYEIIDGKQVRMCSIDHVKDYVEGYSGEHKMKLVEHHLSNGIFNKAFYLIAQGFDGSNHDGVRKAFDIMVQANMSYWTPTTTFAEAACGVMSATRDFGYDQNVVTNAFATVGIVTEKC